MPHFALSTDVLVYTPVFQPEAADNNHNCSRHIKLSVSEDEQASPQNPANTDKCVNFTVREVVQLFTIRWDNKTIAQAPQDANIIHFHEQKDDSSYYDNWYGISPLMLLYKCSGE